MGHCYILASLIGCRTHRTCCGTAVFNNQDLSVCCTFSLTFFHCLVNTKILKASNTGGGGGGGGGGGQGRGIAIFWPIPDLQVRTFGSFVASEGTFVFCTKLLGNYNTEQCQRKVYVVKGHFICTLVGPVDSFWHILPPPHTHKKRLNNPHTTKVEKVNKMPKYAISEMITLKVLWKQNKKQQ